MHTALERSYWQSSPACPARWEGWEAFIGFTVCTSAKSQALASSMSRVGKGMLHLQALIAVHQ